MYSHEVYTDSTGNAEQVTRRQLGERTVVERKIGSGKIARELENIDEAELPQFELEWRGETQKQIDQPRKRPSQSEKQVGQPAKQAPSGRWRWTQIGSQPHACEKQHYANGAAVEVMLLPPGQHESDDWARATVTGMSCDGKYQLQTPAGNDVQPALETGIQAKHLRKPEPDTKLEDAAGRDPLRSRLVAAETALANAKKAVAAEKQKKLELQRAAKQEAARDRMVQIDADLQEAEKAHSYTKQWIKRAEEAQREAKQRIEKVLEEKASLAAALGTQ